MPHKVPTFRPPGAVAARQAAVRQYERGKDRQADKDFYKSKPWLRLRDLKRQRNPLCEDCLAEGRTVLMAEVHHIKSRKTHPELALDLENLRSLCSSCHSRYATFGRSA